MIQFKCQPNTPAISISLPCYIDEGYSLAQRLSIFLSTICNSSTVSSVTSYMVNTSLNTCCLDHCIFTYLATTLAVMKNPSYNRQQVTDLKCLILTLIPYIVELYVQFCHSWIFEYQAILLVIAQYSKLQLGPNHRSGHVVSIFSFVD